MEDMILISILVAVIHVLFGRVVDIFTASNIVAGSPHPHVQYPQV
jgi:hypothetical protein